VYVNTLRAERELVTIECRIPCYHWLVRQECGSWVRDVEFTTLEWVNWFNNSRLLGAIGNIPPIELEENYYNLQETPATVAGLK